MNLNSLLDAVLQSLGHHVKKLHLNAVVNPCHAFLLQIIFRES